MNTSLRTLLADSIDYAGIFPPASLDLPTSIRNFANYRQSAEAWMLGRFVCPVKRLDELELPLQLLSAARPTQPKSSLSNQSTVPLSVIIAPCETLDELCDQVAADMESLFAFQSVHENEIQIGSIELKLTANALADCDSRCIAEFFASIDDAAVTFDATSLRMFFEVPAEYSNKVMAELHSEKHHNIGLKFRMGGKGVQVSAAQLAEFISRCRINQIPFKATAGLHHPLSHAQQDQWQCGFLNLFVATVISAKHSLSTSEIRELLCEESLDSISIRPESIRWNDFQISSGEIEESRLRSLTSFGSCSFDEPRDGLRQLGLL